MSLETVRKGLRDAFKAVHPNWNAPALFNGITQLPAIVVLPTFGASGEEPPANYGMDFNGSVRWNLRVLILVEMADAESADRTLSDMVSPDNPLSVPAILDARRNREIRGANIGLVICRELSAYGKEYSVAGTTALGAEFVLRVEED